MQMRDSRRGMTKSGATKRVAGPMIDLLESRMLLSASPQIAVAANGSGIANGDVTPSMNDFTDFGPMNVATGSVTRTFKIKNPGTAPLNLTNIGIRGLSVGDYSFVSYPASTVAAGGVTRFTVRYNPSAMAVAGNNDAKIKILSNDPANPTYVYSITGEALNMTTKADGLQIATTVAGSGPAAATGNVVQVNYSGYLLDGTKFDSSLNPGRTPYTVDIGTSGVIAGWTEGLVGMKVGERRVLIIPSSLGYTDKGNPPTIPPNATLVFVIDLLHVDPALTISVTDPSGNAIPTGSTGASATNGTMFGAVAVGQSVSLNFLLQTNDLADLRTSATPWVQFTGAGAAAFSLTGATQTATNTVQFTIKFAPASAVISRATVTLYTTAANPTTYTFVVRGTGTSTSAAIIAKGPVLPPIGLPNDALLGGTGDGTLL